MERFAIKTALRLENSPRRKPLILEGARQVGKTWLLKAFAAKEYKKQGILFRTSFSVPCMFTVAVHRLSVSTQGLPHP